MQATPDKKPSEHRFNVDGFLARRWTALLLTFILLAALGLRLYGINWDQGNFFQPDERSIYMRVLEMGWPSSFGEFLSKDSPLNPRWFPLGSILLYALLVIKTVLSPVLDMGMRDLAFAGRTIAILADVASVYMLFALGRKLYGQKVGLLAAGLWAVTVTAIQHSHFYRPEPFIVLFVLCSIWYMLRVVERGRLRDAALLGLFVGLTFAVKLSVLGLLAPLAIGFGTRLFRADGGLWGWPRGGRLRRVALEACLAGLVAIAVFVITEPYGLIDFSTLVQNLTWEADIARKAGQMPYTVQYIGTRRFWYDVQQSVVWSMGLPLGVVAWGGLAFILVSLVLALVHLLFQQGRWRYLMLGEVLMLAWIVSNFLIVGNFEVKFTRYMFPIIPFLVLMGCHMMVWAIGKVREWRPRLRLWALGLAAFVVAATAFYALAFERIYSRPHSAVQASEWINENIPYGSRILADNHWDEGIPDLGRYVVDQLPMFEGDSDAKRDEVARRLSQANYLIFYGKLTYGSIARVPERYPMSAAYYQALFSGGLGYEPVKAFTSYPELLGVAFVDDTFTRAGLTEPDAFREACTSALCLNLGYADNDVVKYDHPKPMVFQNTGRLSESELRAILTRATAQGAQGTMLMSPDLLEAQREGGTWSEIFKPGAWAGRLPVLSWLLLVEVMSLAALPLSFLVLRRLPDRGVFLAKALGILGASYVAWLLASLELMAFSRYSVLVGILAVGALSALALRGQWKEFKGFLRARWRLVLIGEVLFLAAFLSFVAIRMANPDLWHPFRGGEKPMDFAYLNAIIRSTYMPPYDPWFAGGHMNYYYWGHFIVAAPTKTLGIVPEVTYNLAVPLFFALTTLGAFSLAYNITESFRRARSQHRPDRGTTGQLPMAARGAPGQVELPGHAPLGLAATQTGGAVVAAPASHHRNASWGPVLAGVAAALFVAVLGNLGGAVELARGVGNLIGGGRFEFFSHPDSYWDYSRMIPVLENMEPSILRFWLPGSSAPDMGYHITEFPYFTFMFADLHAHLMSLPFTLLVLGLALSLLLEVKRGVGRSLVPLVAALALALGSLAAINTWDYPPYIVVTVGAIALGVLLRGGRLSIRIGLFLALAAGLVLLSYLAFLPFHLSNDTSGVGIEASKWATPIYSYLGMFGLFLVIVATVIVHRWRTVLDMLRRKWWAWASALVVLPALIWLAVAGYWTAVLLGALLLPTVVLLAHELLQQNERSTYRVFLLGMLCMALLMSGGVEFIRMKPDIGRMNTLFKLYLEVWVLLGVASACALWWLLARTRRPRRLRTWVWLVSWLGLVVLLVGVSLTYTVGATRSRLRDRFDLLPMTLDGMAYMQEATYYQNDRKLQLKWDLEAIEWLRANVQGSPVVLEGRTTQYQWGSRISIYTGLPTVLGWEWHQIQQRPKDPYPVQGRVAIVESIYNTASADRAMSLLQSYDVQYIVVGELERAIYSSSGLAKFDRMLGSELELAYENEGVRIYRVISAS